MHVARCRTMARATPRRAVSCLGVRVVPRIPPAEFFHPPWGLDRLLPASPPRMTRGADGDAGLRDRRACGIDGATCAHNRGLTIRRMPSSLHGLLLWRCYGAECPVRRALRADRDVLSDVLRRRIELTFPPAGNGDDLSYQRSHNVLLYAVHIKAYMHRRHVMMPRVSKAARPSPQVIAV